MSLDYTSFVGQLANMMPIGSTDPGFLTMLPSAIDYSEQRIYRELDLLHTQVSDSTTTVSSGDRLFTLPTGQGTYLTVDQFNVILPAGTLSSVGTRQQLQAVSPEYIDAVYPAVTQFTGMPRFYAMRSNTRVLLGPPPDKPYYAEVIGIQRPAALSSANSSTYLTQYVPDLFFAGAMIFVSGFMRNFGAQSDNPQQAQSWEGQYQTLLKSASVEQARVKHQAEGWTSESPSPIATPPRT